MKTIAAVQAKARFSALLDRASRGELVTVTRRGTPVARIVPVSNCGEMTVQEAVAGLKKLQRNCSLGGLSLRDLISQGRK